MQQRLTFLSKLILTLSFSVYCILFAQKNAGPPTTVLINPLTNSFYLNVMIVCEAAFILGLS